MRRLLLLLVVLLQAAVLINPAAAVGVSNTRSSCNGVFYVSQHMPLTLRSPNYPGRYPSGQRCSWRVMPLYGTGRVRITCTDVDLAGIRLGLPLGDYIRISTKSSLSRVALNLDFLHCHNVPFYIEGDSGEEVRLDFVSDGILQRRGFTCQALIHKTTSTFRQCGVPSPSGNSQQQVTETSTEPMKTSAATQSEPSSTEGLMSFATPTDTHTITDTSDYNERQTSTVPETYNEQQTSTVSETYNEQQTSTVSETYNEQQTPTVSDTYNEQQTSTVSDTYNEQQTSTDSENYDKQQTSTVSETYNEQQTSTVSETYNEQQTSTVSETYNEQQTYTDSDKYDEEQNSMFQEVGMDYKGTTSPSIPTAPPVALSSITGPSAEESQPAETPQDDLSQITTSTTSTHKDSSQDDQAGLRETAPSTKISVSVENSYIKIPETTVDTTDQKHPTTSAKQSVTVVQNIEATNTPEENITSKSAHKKLNTSLKKPSSSWKQVYILLPPPSTNSIKAWETGTIDTVTGTGKTDDRKEPNLWHSSKNKAKGRERDSLLIKVIKHHAVSSMLKYAKNTTDTRGDAAANREHDDRQQLDGSAVITKGRHASRPLSDWSTRQVGTKIVNGQEARPHSFPWAVFLRITANGNSGIVCGGSLISQRYVMTAAHCVEAAEAVHVMLGYHDLDNPAPLSIEMPASSKVVHPSWNMRSVEHDIALLRLQSDVTFNEVIQPICLPTRSQIGESYAGLTATVMGWGKHGEDLGLSKLLRFTTSTVLTNCRCQLRWLHFVTPLKMCLSGQRSQSPCGGDSGGILQVTSEDGHAVQVGVVSWGSSLGCDAGWPSGYTRVTAYLDWIEENSDLQLPI